MALVPVRSMAGALKALEEIGLSTLEVDAPGQEVKVRAAIDRGDRIPERIVTQAFKDALEANWGDGMSPARTRRAVEKSVEQAVRYGIIAGYVKPGRTRKTANRTGKPLYDTGDLARAIRATARR